MSDISAYHTLSGPTHDTTLFTDASLATPIWLHAACAGLPDGVAFCNGWLLEDRRQVAAFRLFSWDDIPGWFALRNGRFVRLDGAVEVSTHRTTCAV